MARWTCPRCDRQFGRANQSHTCALGNTVDASFAGRPVTLVESYWPPDRSGEILDLTVGAALRAAAAGSPDRVAIIDGATGRRFTYAEVLERAEAVARGLLGRFAPGEHVAVWGPSIAEWVFVQLGSALAGTVLVTVNPAYKPAELQYVLGQSNAAGIFLLPEFRGNPMAQSVAQVQADLPALREVLVLTELDELIATGSADLALPTVSPHDPVALLYTSGTTGFPKGALQHHRGQVNNGRLTATRLTVEPGDVWVSPMPLFHAGGCVLAVMGAMTREATLVLMPIFDPGIALDLIEGEGAKIFGGVPTMLIAVMEHPSFPTRDLSSLRVVASGGAPVPAELVRRIEATLGVQFGIVFGQTECSAVATQTRLDDTPDDKSETVGQPLPHTEVKVIDPADGAIVAPGVLGEVCIRGYCVMLGYHNMADATAETIDADGWLHTGDLGTLDERGYLKIEGRLKDMVIRGGENIYPREIEAVLFEHPAVADVAVVGVPDDKWGEQLCAFIRLAGDETPSQQELRSYVRDHLAPYKTPQYWEFISEFPLTPSGKVQKFVLREQWIKSR
jgi:fatty-acyl-CoA synthase